MQGDDIRAGEKFVQRHVLEAQHPRLVTRVRIVGDDDAAETLQDFSHYRADLSGAHDAYGPAVQLESEKAVEGEIALTHAAVCSMQFSVQGEDQADGVLGDGMGRVGGYPHDGQA